MNDIPSIWLAARASGLIAYLLLTATMVAGLTLSTRPFGRRLKPATVTEIHRTLSLAGLTALTVHLATLVADTSVTVPVLGVFVPGLVEYRPLATAIGVAAFDFMVLIAVSFPARKFMGIRSWRRLHYLSFLAYLMAAGHGIAAGTDTTQPVVQWMYISTISLVVTLTTFRALGARKKRARAARSARSRDAGSRRDTQPDGAPANVFPHTTAA